MSEEDKALIGVQKCGCVTYANARPDEMTKKERADITEEMVSSGGSLITTTVGEARAMPNFMPGECPHDPKGWERSR